MCEDEGQGSQEDNLSIDDAVVTTIQGTDLVPLVTEYTEIGVDAALNGGILRDIPLVGTIVGLANIGLSVRDRLFLKKLLQFLNSLKDIPADQRQEMVTRLQEDPDYGRDVGEHLIDLLEKVDSERKPTMLARVFTAYVQEQIDARMMHRLIAAIERIPFFEVDSVRRVHEQSQAGQIDEPEHTMQALVGAGLMFAQSGWGGLVYSPTELCGVFVELDLDRKPE